MTEQISLKIYSLSHHVGPSEFDLFSRIPSVTFNEFDLPLNAAAAVRLSGNEGELALVIEAVVGGSLFLSSQRRRGRSVMRATATEKYK